MCINVNLDFVCLQVCGFRVPFGLCKVGVYAVVSVTTLVKVGRLSVKNCKINSNANLAVFANLGENGEIVVYTISSPGLGCSRIRYTSTLLPGTLRTIVVCGTVLYFITGNQPLGIMASTSTYPVD